MIPFPVAPLTGATVLVTRPEPQAQALCERIRASGGEAVALPAIAVERLECEPPRSNHDWLVFVSVHAVHYGLAGLTRSPTTRIAAIGTATSAALAAADVAIDAVPLKGSTSEDLLQHPALADVAGRTVLLVKGRGGRDVLQEQLTARGATVSALEVYIRRRPEVAPDVVAAIENRWIDPGIDVVTLTSVETLENLLAMLGETGRERLRVTPFVTFSPRIAAAARDHGLRGECILARAADQDALVGAIAAWYARAR